MADSGEALGWKPQGLTGWKPVRRTGWKPVSRGDGFGGLEFLAEGAEGLVEEGAYVADGEAGGGGDVAVAEVALEFEFEEFLLSCGQGSDEAVELGGGLALLSGGGGAGRGIGGFGER